jgi:uncharacterized protein (DUF779 family)
MTINYEKKVLLPIIIPNSQYCWDGVHGPCSYFSNEHVIGECDLHMGYIKCTKDGLYLKPDKCKYLMEVEE